MEGNLASNALYRKHKEDESLLESINYWMSKCAFLQQEVDVLNEKLANASVIKWKTGEPKENGIYLVTTTRGIVRTAYWNTCCWLINDLPFSTLKIKAWCKLSDIQPYIGEKVNNEKKP